MKKLNKLLSVFIIAGAVGAGCFGTGCHKHKFSDEWVNNDPSGHWHAATCKHTDQISSFGEHADGDDDDFLCDTCGYDMQKYAESVSLDINEKELKVGETVTLRATVTPADVTQKGCIWYSDNTNVATVDENGVVTAVAEGKANVSASSKDGGKKATCVVTVTADVAVPPHEEHIYSAWSVTKTPSPTTKGEATRTCSAEGTCEGAELTKELPELSETDYTITDGTAEGKKTYTLIADNTISFEADKLPPVVKRVESVSVAPTEVSIAVGGAPITLTATITPADATDTRVSWKSDNTSAATVSEDGVITAVGVGSAVITVTTNDGEKTATCTVTVTEAELPPVDPTVVSGVGISKLETTLKVGQTDNLQAFVAPETAINKNCTWTSSAEAVATVDGNGVVTAVAPGSAVITVTTEDGGFTATCSVTVEARAHSISAAQYFAALRFTKTTTNYTCKSGETVAFAVDEAHNAAEVGGRVYVFEGGKWFTYDKVGKIIIKTVSEDVTAETFTEITGVYVLDDVLDELIEGSGEALENVTYDDINDSYTFVSDIYGDVSVVIADGKVVKLTYVNGTSGGDVMVGGKEEYTYGQYGSTSIDLTDYNNALEKVVVAEAAVKYNEGDILSADKNKGYGLYADLTTDAYTDEDEEEGYYNKDYVVVTGNGFKQVVGSEESKNIYISLELLKGTVEGTFDIAADKLFNGWEFIKFVSLDETKLTVTMGGNGALVYKIDGGELTTPHTTVAIAADTMVNVRYAVSQVGGSYKLTVKVNGTAFAEANLGAEALDYVILGSYYGDGGAGLLTVDNVAVSGETLTRGEFNELIMSRVEALREEMIGTEDNHGTHWRNMTAVERRLEIITTAIDGHLITPENGDPPYYAYDYDLPHANEYCKRIFDGFDYIDSDADIDAAINVVIENAQAYIAAESGKYTEQKSGFDAVAAAVLAELEQKAETCVSVREAENLMFEEELDGETVFLTIEQKFAAKIQEEGVKTDEQIELESEDMDPIKVAEAKADARETLGYEGENSDPGVAFEAYWAVNYGETNTEIKSIYDAIAAAKAEYDAAKAEYDVAYADFRTTVKPEYDAVKPEYDAAKAEYDAAKAEYEAAQVAYEAAYAAYEAVQVAYEAAQAEYEAAKAEYEADPDNEDKKEIYDDKKLTCDIYKEEFDAKKEDFDAKKELCDAKKEVYDAKKEVYDAKKVIYDEKKEPYDAKKEVYTEIYRTQVIPAQEKQNAASKIINDLKIATQSAWSAAYEVVEGEDVARVSVIANAMNDFAAACTAAVGNAQADYGKLQNISSYRSEKVNELKAYALQKKIEAWGEGVGHYDDVDNTRANITAIINTFETDIATSYFNTVDSKFEKAKSDIDQEISALLDFKYNIRIVDENGTDVVSVTQVEFGKYVVAPEEDPVKDGYTFIGYYEDSDYAKSFDFEHTEIYQNTVIYAKFEALPPPPQEGVSD